MAFRMYLSTGQQWKSFQFSRQQKWRSRYIFELSQDQPEKRHQRLCQTKYISCVLYTWYPTISCVLRSPILELWRPNFICEQKWDEEGKTFNPIRQSEAKAGKWNVVEVKFEKDKFWKRQIWKRQIWRQSTTFPRLQIRQTPHNRKKSKYWRQPSLGIWGEGCTGTLVQTLVHWYKTAGQLYSTQSSG